MAKSPKKTFTENAANSSQNANDNLPTWDLDTMFGYKGYGSPEFEAEFTAMAGLIQNFIDNYKNVVGALSGDELADALDAEHEIDGLASKIWTYVDMKNVKIAKLTVKTSKLSRIEQLSCLRRQIFSGMK